MTKEELAAAIEALPPYTPGQDNQSAINALVAEAGGGPDDQGVGLSKEEIQEAFDNSEWARRAAGVRSGTFDGAEYGKGAGYNEAVLESNEQDQKGSDLLNDLPAADAFMIDPEGVKQYETGDPLEAVNLDLKKYDMDRVTELAGPNAFDEFEAPGEGREAQMDALGNFRDISRSGTDAVADAEYARRGLQAEQRRRSQDEATMAEMEQRGLLGSGDELQQRLNANQAMATDASQAGTQAAGQMQMRRDAALGAYSNLGGTIRGADFTEEGYLTEKDQEYNRYLSDEQLGAYGENVGIENDERTGNADAQTDVNLTNFTRGNAVSDANVSGFNDTTEANRGAMFDYFGQVRPNATSIAMGGDQFSVGMDKWQSEQPTMGEDIGGGIQDVFGAAGSVVGLGGGDPAPKPKKDEDE